MEKIDNTNQPVRMGNYLKLILGSLIIMFVTGAGMTSIGQSTNQHVLSHSGSIFWHTLLGLHLVFLAVLAVGALSLTIRTFTAVPALRARTVRGLIAILFGIISGILVLHKIHPGIFLFCMALSFIAIGSTYGPLGTINRKKD